MKVFLIIVAILVIVGFVVFLIVSLIRSAANRPTDDIGFMVSRDAGRTWTLPTYPGRVAENLQPAFLNFVPDPRAKNQMIFAGTRGRGLLISRDRGTNWEPVEAEGIPPSSSIIFNMVISEKNPHPVYLAVFHDRWGRLLKSETIDKLSFNEVYRSSSEHFAVFDVAVDPVNNDRILLATGEGGLLESQDAGSSWRVLRWFEDSVTQVLVRRDKPNTIVVLTIKGQAWISLDGGKTWSELMGDTNRNISPKDIKHLDFHPIKAELILVATTEGFFLGDVERNTWSRIELSIPPSDRSLSASAVDPLDPRRVIIAAGRRIYLSENAALTWSLVGEAKRGTIVSLWFHPYIRGLVFSSIQR